LRKWWLVTYISLLLIIVGCSNSTSSQTAADESAKGTSDIDYPKKPIEILVPYAAGGSTDIGARIISEYLPKYLPEAEIVVVNKPGGGGTIGITDLYNSNSDGHKIAMTTHRVVSLQPLYGKTEYQHDSFKPIANVFSNEQLVVVKKDAPWKTFEEWFEYVQNNPGKFTYGVSAGIGSGAHLPMADLEMTENLVMKPVAFDGTAPAISALLGGHVQSIVAQPIDVKGYLESGELRALFNVGSKPVPFSPDTPILKEKGYDIVYDSHTILIAQKNVPVEIIQVLQEAVQKTLKDPEVIEQFEKVNIQVNYQWADWVQEELNKENKRLKVILKDLGLIK
jgi:tripartite-type tricarboxylate transporter receptor subunit TctC